MTSADPDNFQAFESFLNLVFSNLFATKLIAFFFRSDLQAPLTVLSHFPSQSSLFRMGMSLFSTRVFRRKEEVSPRHNYQMFWYY